MRREKIYPNIAAVVDIPSRSMHRFKYYFTFIRKTLSLAGLWHTQPYRERLIRYCIVGFMLLYSVLGELCQLLTLKWDLPSAVRAMQVIVPALCVADIYATGIQRFVTFQKIYNYIKHDLQRLKDDNELKIIENHNYNSALLAISFGLMIYIYVIISVSPSFLRIILYTNEIRRDTDHYPIISCFDYFVNRETYYYPIVIYQIIITVLLCTLVIAIYSTYFLFIHHIYAQLSIIEYKIYNPFISNDHNHDGPVTPIDLSFWIIDIVQRLARTKKYITMMNTSIENTYSIYMLLVLIILIMDFLCLFQIPVLLQDTKSREDVLAFILFIFSTIVMVYIHCYIGQRLIDYSVNVYQEACLVSIYNLSLKTQKLLLTALMISSKPLTIPIGKVYVSSHEFFSDILRSSLSFAMVLHSAQRI